MTREPTESRSGPASSAEADGAREAVPARPPLLRGLFGFVRQIGSDLVDVALGRGDDAGGGAAPPASAPRAESTSEPRSPRSLAMLHGVTDALRGAADQYIAAKLDEIEARVDAKLDEIESRLDEKIAEVHGQFQQLRDAELRHRLRLLKLTLIFTVLVALLSLGYKWLTHWLNA